MRVSLLNLTFLHSLFQCPWIQRNALYVDLTPWCTVVTHTVNDSYVLHEQTSDSFMHYFCKKWHTSDMAEKAQHVRLSLVLLLFWAFRSIVLFMPLIVSFHAHTTLYPTHALRVQLTQNFSFLTKNKK